MGNQEREWNEPVAAVGKETGIPESALDSKTDRNQEGVGGL